MIDPVARLGQVSTDFTRDQALAINVLLAGICKRLELPAPIRINCGHTPEDAAGDQIHVGLAKIRVALEVIDEGLARGLFAKVLL